MCLILILKQPFINRNGLVVVTFSLLDNQLQFLLQILEQLDGDATLSLKTDGGISFDESFYHIVEALNRFSGKSVFQCCTMLCFRQVGIAILDFLWHMLVKRIVTDLFGQTVLIDAECKRGERFARRGQ